MRPPCISFLLIREKLNVPEHIAETLQNLGTAYAALGQYDQAMASYMRGLDIYRKAGDNLGAARVAHSIGLVFGYQGRLGSAVGALQDSVKVFRDLGSDAQVEKTAEGWRLQAYGCPLSAVTAGHPEMCELGQALVEEVVGAPVTECCERGGHPRCGFTIAGRN